ENVTNQLLNNGHAAENNDNLTKLLKAFIQAIDNLCKIENYAPEMQRIILDFSKINKTQLLFGYLFIRFVNPSIMKFSTDSKNDERLRFWCQKIIMTALLVAINGEISKKSSNQKKIFPLISLVYNTDFREQVNGKITSALNNTVLPMF